MQNMIKNQSLFFVSLIGIILVSSVMATTYAYQSLRVDYVSGSKNELTVSSGVLDVTFEITNRIDIKNMVLLPSYKTSDYMEFIVDNTKSSSKVGYRISLVGLDYSENIRNEYFRYTIVKVNEDNSLEELGSGSFANLTEDYIDLYFDNGLYDYIDAGTSYKIRLYLWTKEAKSVNQSNLLNTYFKGKLNISSVFSSDVNYEKESNIFEVGTLADKIVSNAMLGVNGTVYLNNLTIPAMDTSEEYERTLSTIEDSYGTTYYFRGNVLDNYLNFNNMCWRVVRIEGDGSIKLILEDSNNTCENINGNLGNNGLITNENGIVLVKNDLINKNNLEGNLSFELNKWYDLNNFSTLSSYLKLDTICHNGTDSYKILDIDKNLNILRSNSSVYGYINNKLVLMNEDNYKLQCNNNIENNNIISNEDTMYCNEWYYDIYKRLNMDTTKEVKLICNDNEKSENNISILSADEVILAGYLTNESNTNYLSNSVNWWTSSVAYQSLDKEYMYYVGNNLSTDNKENIYGIRPTITLRTGILYEDGNGTISKPYSIKLNNEES